MHSHMERANDKNIDITGAISRVVFFLLFHEEIEKTKLYIKIKKKKRKKEKYAFWKQMKRRTNKKKYKWSQIK